ncbi:MAG: ATP-binding protein, partial [Gemmatimonas sp.]
VMQPVVLNLSALVVNLHDLLQRLIGEDIALVVTENTQPGMVRADPVQIEQVILNLAVNARDAMPNAGVMTIEVQNVDLDGLAVVGSASVPSGPYVLLAVSDTGKGMDDVTRSRIFEPFFTTKELGKGTGLGLSTVYGIVSQTGGHIVVDSKLGRGSSFLIYLPRVDSSTHPAVRRTPAMTPQVAATETILIVEDEEVVRHLAVRMLQLAGYTVLSAGNGPEALALIERQVLPVHMVFTDAVMPLMTGGELATHIEALYPNTKVLFTSGYTDDEKIHGTMPGPSTHFIGKPYSGSDLRRKVREVLDLGPTTVVSV